MTLLVEKLFKDRIGSDLLKKVVLNVAIKHFELFFQSLQKKQVWMI